MLPKKIEDEEKHEICESNYFEGQTKKTKMSFG